MNTQNPATTWSHVLVQALADAGLRAVCVAPGSRSTSLTLAFAAHPEIQLYRHLDERSAAFFALGLALSTNQPVALACTSGTATANFLPAIIEAHMSQVPLLVLTADRPPELRHSGANQTIDQVKMYADQVLWSVDMALPQADPPEVALRNVAATAARAYALANGLRKGVVHLNLPFRKPLEPDPQPEPASAVSAPPDPLLVTPQLVSGILAPTPQQLQQLAHIIATHPRGLIVCGPACPGGDFPQAVAALSAAAGYPLLAEPLSNVRFGSSATVVGSYETMMAGGRAPGWPEPQLILRFGAVPTSKWLNHYLESINPAYRLHVRASGVWADDAHQTTNFYQLDEATLCQALVEALPPRADTLWLEQVMRLESRAWELIDGHLAGSAFDAAYVSDLFAALSPGSLLFLGNSLPVRHADQFARPVAKGLRLFGNRGASGIDGNISTALGVAAGAAAPLVALVGDITFYHDLNALLTARLSATPLTIVLLNNNGGGIFQRLPVHAFDPPFTELFLTPHGLAFEPLARAFQLQYALASDRPHFRRLFSQATADPRPWVIEVRTDSRDDEQIRQGLVKAVKRQLDIDTPR